MKMQNALAAEVADRDPGYEQLKTRLHRELIESLDLSRLAELEEDVMRSHIRDLAQTMLRRRPEKLVDVDEDRLVDELVAESFGLGPLEPYMSDPDVSDILVNGPHEVFVERHGRLHETNTVFADEQHLMQIIQRVVARVGRRVDEQSPMVDARLPDGSRVNAIIPPLAIGGPILSIRRFGAEPLQMDDLLAGEALSPAIASLLQAAVAGRVNVMISGGAGAGKTTLLNALSRYIPTGERIVTVEDSAELRLQRRHVVSLETRCRNSEGGGEVTQRDLVRNSLRMRPDRILVGEVRGGEALDMLQAMNTGHDGSMTTIHANDCRDALSRLEVMTSMAGFDLPVAVVRNYVASAVALVVHVARLQGGVRRVTRVSELCGVDGGDYELRDLFVFDRRGADARGLAIGDHRPTGLRPKFLSRLEAAGVELPDSLFEDSDQ